MSPRKILHSVEAITLAHFPFNITSRTSGTGYRIVTYVRLAETLYEAISYQFEPPVALPLSLTIDFVVHYFPECPTFTGPFGRSADLFTIANDTHKVAIRPYIAVLPWLEFPTLEELDRLLAYCVTFVSPWIAAARGDLLSDDVLGAAKEVHDTLLGEGRRNVSEGEVLERIRSLTSKTHTKYPMDKIACQIAYKLAGDKQYYTV